MWHQGVLGPWSVLIFQSRSLWTSARYSSPRNDVGSLLISGFSRESPYFPFLGPRPKGRPQKGSFHTITLAPRMTPRLAVGVGSISLIALSLLVASFPLASAQSTTIITIPKGSGFPAGAPGFSPATATVVIGVNNTVEWTNNDTVA